ncbi:MAG TPA: cupredoxin family protein [Burkholderiales bacterium]|nr:cupredoxin family protein [Burkholderiales bacterium]
MHKLFVFAIAALIVAKTYAHDEEPPKPASSHEHSATGHEHRKSEETASGRPGDPTKVSRTITVQMRDPVEFSPAQIAVIAGETVRFVVVNAGKHEHEMVLGTMKELEEHHEMMKQHPGMHHEEPHRVELAPGKSGVIVWQFTKPGEFFYACLVEDHFELGMYGKITVRAQPENPMPGEAEIRVRQSPFPHAIRAPQGLTL